VAYDSRSLTPSQGRFLSFDPATNLYSYEGSRDTSYVRKIFVTLVGPDEMAVNSVVSWTSRGGGSSEINLEDHFFNWRP